MSHQDIQFLYVSTRVCLVDKFTRFKMSGELGWFNSPQIKKEIQIENQKWRMNNCWPKIYFFPFSYLVYPHLINWLGFLLTPRNPSQIYMLSPVKRERGISSLSPGGIKDQSFFLESRLSKNCWDTHIITLIHIRSWATLDDYFHGLVSVRKLRQNTGQGLPPLNGP